MTKTDMAEVWFKVKQQVSSRTWGQALLPIVRTPLHSLSGSTISFKPSYQANLQAPYLLCEFAVSKTIGLTLFFVSSSANLSTNC